MVAVKKLYRFIYIFIIIVIYKLKGIMNKRRLIVHERQSVKYFYLSISNAGGQTYVASFLLAILDVRSSKVVEAAAMVVAFIIPRVKSTVALRAVGHLAMWLL